MKQLLLFLVLLPLTAGAEEWSRGPIALANNYPLSLIHASFSPGSTEILDPGEIQLGSSFVWSNTQNYRSGSYSVDAEQRVLNLRVDLGISEDWQLSLALPLIWRGGGVLDSPIDAWHRFFGFPRGGRNETPTDRYQIRGKDQSGDVWNLENSGLKLGNLSLTPKVLIYPGSECWPELSAEFAISLPTGSDASVTHNNIDLGVTLRSSKSFGDFALYFSTGYFRYLDTSTDGLEFRSDNYALSFQGEYAFSKAFALSLGPVLYSDLVGNVPRFPEYSLYLDLGARYVVSENWALEGLIRENPAPRKGTTDVIFLLGARYHFS